MAVKTYSLKKDGHLYCSEHTQVCEMKCKDGSDKILIDEKLMEMVELLFSTLKCSKYIITSGYRTPEHDKKVGGNGYGQHTKGTAVDAIFYGADKNPISAKEVSCIAQDLGFKGIANITSKNEEIHLDMRTSGTYKGNEIHGTKNVTSDFYAYYGINRNVLRQKYGLPIDTKINVTYQVRAVKGCWYGNVLNDTDYAGKFGNSVCCVFANLNQGNIYYRVHTKDGKWLPEVKNRIDYAGIANKPIDAIALRTDTGKKIHYQVHTKGIFGKWLPYVTDCNINDTRNGFAGVFGKEIDSIRMYIE